MKTGKFATNRSAFTLLELIVVILILSIIAGLATGNFKRTFDRYALFKAADDLAYHMRYAQSRAVTKNKTLRLQFDSALRSYSLAQSGDTSGLLKESSFEPWQGKMSGAGEIPADLTIESDESEIYFYPDGNVDKTEITVCRQTRCYTITTREQRGFIRMFESENELK